MATFLTPSFEDALSVTFETMFRARLKEGGVKINNLFETIKVTGASSFLQQKAEAGKLAFWKRRLTPTQYTYEMSIDEFDIVRTGGFDPGRLAEDAAEGCSRTLDEIVVEAMTADVYCDNNKVIPFNKKQYITYDYNPLGEDAEKAAKLTSSKILKAVEKMRTNGVKGTIVAFASYPHLTEFQQDVRVASTDFNVQPAQATGITNPYGGISGFVPTLLLPQNVKSQKGGQDDPMVDHIYVVGTDYIKIGTNMPWKLNSGLNPERRYNFNLCMTGAYDAVRAEEAGVVIIEAAHVDSESIV